MKKKTARTTTPQPEGRETLARYNAATLVHGGGNTGDLLVTVQEILAMDADGFRDTKRTAFLISEALRSKGEFIEGMGAILISIATK